MGGGTDELLPPHTTREAPLLSLISSLSLEQAGESKKIFCKYFIIISILSSNKSFQVVHLRNRASRKLQFSKSVVAVEYVSVITKFAL